MEKETKVLIKPNKMLVTTMLGEGDHSIEIKECERKVPNVPNKAKQIYKLTIRS